jgi:outer membrane autotransporter protein
MRIYGGYSPQGGEANHNTVIIDGWAVASKYDIIGGWSQYSNSNYNNVWIGDVDFTDNVDKQILGGLSNGGNATNNTVTIFGSPVAFDRMEIYGGYSSSGDDFTGNTLNVRSSNLTLSSILRFQNFNFYLPTSLETGKPIISLSPSGNTELSHGIVDSQVSLYVEGAASAFNTGDTIILIDGSAGSINGKPANDQAEVSQGATLNYVFDLKVDNNQLIARLSKEPIVNQEAKALPEAQLAVLSMIEQGGELAANQGLGEAVKAARLTGQSEGIPLALFTSFAGAQYRQKTGSHVDVSGYSFLLGLAFGADLGPGFLTLGAFFEYGKGSYDTYNSFANAAPVHGSGDISYVGGGLVGRLDFNEVGPGHIYVEATGRMGRASNFFISSDLTDNLGQGVEFDSSSSYIGFHVGTGYVWKITDLVSLDFYGKYFWTKQEGDQVTLPTGDQVTFKDAFSSRLRLGGRLSLAVNDHFRPYVGAAYEWEFDGKARALAYGYPIKTPSTRGGTASGELGLSITPSSSVPFSIDLGVQGYTGKKEGVRGSVFFNYVF